MVLKVLTQDQGVVQESQHNIPGEAPQHQVHGSDKSDRGIAQSEPHPNIIVQAVPGDEGRLPLVLRSDHNLVKGGVSVQLREPHVPGEGVQAVIYKKQWKYALSCHIVQAPVIQAPPYLTVLLPD